MAITATIPYGGLTFSGMTFSVKSAYVKELVGEEPYLSYSVEVKLPDGTIQQSVGWDSVKAVADPAEPSPLVQAEAAMIARLQATGATNIVEV